ncbi:MAG: DMT family transporter [Anaerolineae bacterium]|nr:DMT family transporter [Anaerolineae bacterium]MCX8066246.1 DMT family transporter [Anaerolineae bacterium]MDW7990899.1 DMT family transporter [Anaerolineae bacterium]
MGRSAGSPPFPPVLALVVGVLAASTASPIIRLAQEEVNSLAIAAWRLTLASLILAPITLTTRRDELRALRREDWLLMVGSGVLLAVHFATWISSLAYTSVAASVVLVSTSPLFVGLGSYLLLKERLSGWLVAGLIVATAGSVIIGLDALGEGTHRMTGDLLALAGAISVAGYFLVGRRLRARLSLLAYVFPVYSVAAVTLMAVAALARIPLSGYPPIHWLWLLLLALGPQITGHSSLNWALRHLPATYVTLAVLGEPIGSSILAWIILREVPSVLTLVGGAVVLAGIAVASRE